MQASASATNESPRRLPLRLFRNWPRCTGCFLGAPVGESEEEVARFRDHQLLGHIAHDGVCAVVARDDKAVVGFAYGYPGQRGRWWRERLAANLPASVAAMWLGGHLEFVELAVMGSRQSQGIGGWLHDLLLEALPHRRAPLWTWTWDAPARRL